MQIREICNSMPNSESGRQTLLFSATMPKVLIEFTKSGIMDSDPQVVRLDKDATVSDELRIGFITIRSQEKDGALLHLLRDILPGAVDHGNAKLEEEERPEDGDADVEEEAPTHKKDVGKKGKKRSDGRKQNERHPLGLMLIFAATRHHVDYLTMLINNAGLGKGLDGESIATCIYGSMDQEARKLNLSAFKSGRTPILIVTDVAARGIDIPLIDHVIHYSFPPTAKLFVHRSGRAARAGRVGYCWGLVDSEEMPYMVDLHLFLGRKLATGQPEAIEGEEDGEESEKKGHDDVTYAVKEMTPDMVHYGSIPESTSTAEVENVRRIIESELTGSHESDALQCMVRICNNAMKQYRRSRPEASKQGVRRAKAILEGKKGLTGRRIGGGMIPAHPVLRKAEIDRVMGTTGVTKESAKAKLDDMKQREDMLKAMANFRPKETVFEAFATGGTRIASVLGQVDKANTTGGGKRYDPSAAFTAMKSMRRQMALAQQKGTSMVVAGSDKALQLNGERDGPAFEAEGEFETLDIAMNSAQKRGQRKAPKIIEKQRLSKAERKRMKKDGSNSAAPSLSNSQDVRVKDKRGSDFRDKSFYMDTIAADTEEDSRSRHIEAAMQPSAASNKSGVESAMRLEEAMLDIVGDENSDMVKNQRITRWDKSKRKYVQTTIGMETSGLSKTKKLKLESGQIVKSGKLKLGEAYEKWQKKTNKSIGRVGVFDDIDEDHTTVADPSGYARKTPVVKKKKQTEGDGIMTATQIRKKRESDKKTKIKNMPKKERTQLYVNKRSVQKKVIEEARASGQGWQGKKGSSGRYGATPKGKFVNKGKM